jgi:outer membrane protein assembly factor BamB
MGNKIKKTMKIPIVVFIALLISSALLSCINFETTSASGAISTQSELLQYEWPQAAHDDEHTRFSAGPAPDRPDLVRTLPATPSTLFNGKYWYTSSNRLYARDAFTDAVVINASCPMGGSSPTKLDDTYLYMDINGGVVIHKISDGSFVSNFNVTQLNAIDVWGNMPGTQQYNSNYGFSAEYKWRYRMHYNLNTRVSDLYAIDMSNPLAPKLGWIDQLNQSEELISFGDGQLFMGSTNGYCITALNATTGAVTWEAQKIGFCTYSATYYEGKLYQFGASTRLTCYNGTTGAIIWDYDAGGRAFSSYGGCAAYGRVYWHCIDPYGGYIGCWNAETGLVEWKTPAWYSAGYVDPAIADGKLYYVRSDGSTVAGRPAPSTMFTCLDAFSGKVLWDIPGSVANPMIAYGNLYLGAKVYSTVVDPTDWTYYRGNMNNPGIYSNRTGPSGLANGPVWTYATDGAITSSPAVVDGRVYVGSYDKNWYCINASTGSLIWNFTIAHRAQSSPAIDNGRMYTGADDGYFRCLDATTGVEIWKVNVYAGNVPEPFTEVASFQPRSSPIVVGDKIYCGALDGKVYCLSIYDGRLQWSYNTGMPILGSPTIWNNTIYIASTDKNVYALNAATGTKVWNWTSPMSGLGLGYRFHLFMVSTPVIAEGKIFIGIGAEWDSYLTGYAPPTGYPGAIHFAALNASTGAKIWIANQSGNSQQPFAATYYNGQITLPNGTNYRTGGLLIMPEQMGISIYNATDGSKLWLQWLGHQVFTSVAIAEDPTVGGLKFYAGSDSYGITCFNGTAAFLKQNGTVLGEFNAGAQCPSSPALYNGRLFAASADGSLYCFDDSPTMDSSLFATSDKGSEMWNNETITIAGKLTLHNQYPNPFNPSFIEQLYPGVPNATINVSFTKPDMTSVNQTTTCDLFGNFQVSFSPTEVGNWGWVAYYEGLQRPTILYGPAYSEWTAFAVVQSPIATPTTEVTPTPTYTPTPTAPPSPTPVMTPTPTGTNNLVFGMPAQYAYAAIVAVIVIIVIAVASYMYRKNKTQKSKQ